MFSWLYGSVWWPFRNWISNGVSAFSPMRPVPTMPSPEQADVIVRHVTTYYKADPWGGALDYSYDPRVIEAHRQAGTLGTLPALDCDDVAFYAWALLYDVAQNPAVVILFDDGPKALHHCVFAFDWGGSSWTLDTNGLRIRDGQSVADLFSHIYDGAHYGREIWSRQYPFPDPRKA